MGPAFDGDGLPAVPFRGSRREVILAAAIRLFSQYGHGGVGMDDIGATAGMTGPAVYRHFAIKDELLGYALNRPGEQLATSW
jgi:AcrR family transcriptional regulator